MFKATNLYSNLASDGPPLFFPDPPVPVKFNFDQGIASEETFPIARLRQLLNKVLDRDGALALEYISFGYDRDSDSILYLPTYIELVLGHTGLRNQVASWLSRRQGVQGLGPENLILTSGSVQAIALAASGFVNPGDGVLVESTSFPYAIRFMEMRGANVRPVSMDKLGLIPESLEERLLEFRTAGIRPKLLYTIPTFQLPTCVVMPENRRRDVLKIADEWDLVILEDAIYSDLRYEGDPIPSMLALDNTGRVIQSHGFSKILAPALRLGWMCGSPEMITALAAVRQDLGVSQLLCRVMEEYLAEGLLDSHIEQANTVYRRKRDIAASAVRRNCGQWVDFEVPQGGFYLWLRISDAVDWEKASNEAALGGVFFRPGERFMAEHDDSRYIRLAYSHAPDHEIERGIRVLGEAISRAV